MKKITALIMALLMVFSLCAYAESAQPAASDEPAAAETAQPSETEQPGETVQPAETAQSDPTEEPGRLSGITIGIDPGHQAHENTGKELNSPKGKEKKAKVASGTSGTKTKVPEYKTVLEVSLLLRDALEAEGATVVMTRETNDVDISNLERALLMNDANADLVLRIHCDGSTKHSVNGTTMYVRKSIAYGKDIVPNPKALLSAEASAAQIMVDAMCAETGAKNRGVCKRDTYTMNNWSTVPIILVELGFMSNADEDVKLNSPDYQAKLVRGMVNGIEEYFNR